MPDGVFLVEKGSTDSLPKHSANVVHRHIRKYAPEYTEFATAYRKKETAKMQELMTKHAGVFERDQNMGIMQQCMAMYLQQAIQRLTSTYLTLSLSDIASTVALPGPKEAETMLLRMIQDGNISARINQKDGMVSFTDNCDSLALMQNIDGQIESTQVLIRRLESMDDEIQVSHDYLTRQMLRDPALRESLEEGGRLGGMKAGITKMVGSLMK
eukprot:NODE_1658_length_1099_cov_81.038095_g1355_i0.p1 GENE.NODE_1658_length_1099_cov_81.038095_g1355_i0~~NODE_1658_length_1099_cov_81.038095_g1355_i0.p1  ORF type:complete len:213 (+),score=71.01 NODE_1658_length_1099_cov_81.038095_g1355_i0:383-1021(+)